MKYLQRWKTRVNKSKQNASMPGPQREMAANYHTCATGARLCDILGVTPDELNDVGSLGNMMYANDQGLHDLSVHFHRQIVACEFGSAAKQYGQ